MARKTNNGAYNTQKQHPKGATVVRGKSGPTTPARGGNNGTYGGGRAKTPKNKGATLSNGC